MDKLQWLERGNTLSAPTAIWRDYLTMTKPKVVAMLLLTALVGM